MTWVLVALYLGAIVLANYLVATFGPWIAPFNAFLLIGLDLTTRDALHDRWRGDQLAIRMVALVVAGGALTLVAAPGAAWIAVASSGAFVLAAMADGIAYELLVDRRRLVRVNGSNVRGAAVDTVVFLVVAFGTLDPILATTLFAAKVGGGFVWSLALFGRRVWRVA
jgi:queuosine precursor transporter